MGMWVAENEGAKFWLSVLTELQHRGVEDILSASVDGLKGFPTIFSKDLTLFVKTSLNLAFYFPTLFATHIVNNNKV
jgi:putative transposase